MHASLDKTGLAFGPPKALPRVALPKTAPLGQILVDQGALSGDDMLRAVAMKTRSEARIGDVLRAQGLVDDAAICTALAAQFDCGVIDLKAAPPDPRLIEILGPAFCLRHGIVPWRRVGVTPVIVTSDPAGFAELRAQLPQTFADALMAVATLNEIESAVSRIAQSELTLRAEERLPPELSSRAWKADRYGQIGLVTCALTLFGLVLSPNWFLLVLSLLAALAVVLTTSLKCAAFVAAVLPRRKEAQFRTSRRKAEPNVLPRISLLVALYDEPMVLPGLVRRLRRLNYPPELLEICLITEVSDRATNRAIGNGALSQPFRHIQVPVGTLNTKPRALNYALEYCQGSIIGVLDAEDAPDPDQLHAVARHFATAPKDVACLQGVLDFYNPRANFLSRCFTLEYAAWFRVFLPGLARLGLVVPLGGTTAYVRRTALVRLGGWDAHNVTEDADLGVRLARNGYRTELVHSITFEEANNRLWPWVKQRSRWLKGYAMTWAVHMRQPSQLLAELGLKRFIGFQILFLGTLMHFLLAPVLVSLWVVPFGFSHPLHSILGDTGTTALFAAFLLTEGVSLALVGAGLIRAGKPKMLVWLPLLHLYFVLASLSLYRALIELSVRPFFWAKTAHGQSKNRRKRFWPRINGAHRKVKARSRHPVSSASRTLG